MKLNQVIALEKGVKSKVMSAITEFHKANQKPDLFNGFTKTYQPKNEDGGQLPGERKRVQFSVPTVLRNLAASLTELMQVTAQKDWSKRYGHR